MQAVTLSSGTPGTQIYYTTDGSTPTTSSSLYAGPLTVSASETIEAISVAPAYSNSPVASATYVIDLPAAMPVFSVAAGSYTSAQRVMLSSGTAGAQIYFRTDGSMPATSSTLYSGPIAVSASETIKALAVAPNYSASPVASAAYVIQLPAAAPVFSVAAGTYTSAQTVALTSTTPGTQIYYTANGSTPTAGSTLYSGPIRVQRRRQFKRLRWLQTTARVP